MPEGKGTYGNQQGRPPKKVKVKNVISTQDLLNDKRNFVLKKDTNNKWYIHYSDGTRGNIKQIVGDQLAKYKESEVVLNNNKKKSSTSHFTVEHVKMKNVKDPEKVPRGKAREQEIANKQAQKKASNNFQKKQKEVKELIATARKANTSGRIKTDANTKKPVSTKFKGKGKAGIALALASLLGLSMSADKSKKKEEPPKRKKRPGRVPPSKSEGSKNIKQQMDSEEVIKARMKADRDSSPVDYEGNYPIYRKDSAPAKSFRKKFNEEKNRLKTQGGSDTFTWQGRKYKIK